MRDRYAQETQYKLLDILAYLDNPIDYIEIYNNKMIINTVIKTTPESNGYYLEDFIEETREVIIEYIYTYKEKGYCVIFSATSENNNDDLILPTSHKEFYSFDDAKKMHTAINQWIQTTP